MIYVFKKNRVFVIANERQRVWQSSKNGLEKSVIPDRTEFGKGNLKKYATQDFLSFFRYDQKTGMTIF